MKIKYNNRVGCFMVGVGLMLLSSIPMYTHAFTKVSHSEYRLGDSAVLLTSTYRINILNRDAAIALSLDTTAGDEMAATTTAHAVVVNNDGEVLPYATTGLILSQTPMTETAEVGVEYQLAAGTPTNITFVTLVASPTTTAGNIAQNYIDLSGLTIMVKNLPVRLLESTDGQSESRYITYSDYQNKIPNAIDIK